MAKPENEAFQRLKRVSTNNIATTLNFTAASDVKAGEVASILIDGSVKTLVNDEKIEGRFLDSIKISDTRMLVLYAKAPQRGNPLEEANLVGDIGMIDGEFGVFAKFIDVIDGSFTYSEEINLGLPIFIDQYGEDRYTLVKEPNGNRIILFREGPGGLAQSAAESAAIGKGSGISMFTINGNSIQVDNVEVGQIETAISNFVAVTINPQRGTFVIAYQNPESGQIELIDAALVTEDKDGKIITYFNASEPIALQGVYAPIQLAYQSAQNVISVASVQGNEK